MNIIIARELPILFNAAMVQAILRDEKTQTRRPVDLKKFTIPNELEELFCWYGGELRDAPNGCAPDGLWCRTKSGLKHLGATPYKPGDLLYVREAWSNGWTTKPVQGDKICYRASPLGEQGFDFAYKWRPSIHMPKWAARIWLEVTGVKVQKIKEITDEEIRAEGVTPDRATDHPRGVYYTSFMRLWDDVYKNWNENPWVFCYEFKRVNHA